METLAMETLFVENPFHRNCVSEGLSYYIYFQFLLPTALWMRSSEALRQQDGCSFGNLLSKSSTKLLQVPFNQRNSPSTNVANQTL